MQLGDGDDPLTFPVIGLRHGSHEHAFTVLQSKSRQIGLLDWGVLNNTVGCAPCAAGGLLPSSQTQCAGGQHALRRK